MGSKHGTLAPSGGRIIGVLVCLAVLAPAASASDAQGTAPSPPVGLVALPANNTTVLLLWQSPLDDGGVNVTDYRVYRTEIRNESIERAFLGQTNETAFVDTDITDGSITFYEYSVTAVNAAGQSDPSNPAMASSGTDSCVGIDPWTVPPTIDITCVPPLSPLGPSDDWAVDCPSFTLFYVNCERE